MALIKGRGVVYQHRNIINNKIYVGSTYNKKRRAYEHICNLNLNRHHCYHLQNAWNKYGKDAFILSEVLEEFDLPEIENTKFNKRIIWRPIVVAREQYYLDTLDGKYNICDRANSNLGMSHSNEMKEKVSKNSQAMWDAHPEYRDQASKRQSDCMTPERREMMRNLRLGKSLVEIFGEEGAKEILIKRKANTDQIARGKAISLGKMGKPRPDIKGKVGPTSISGEYGVLLRSDDKKWGVQIDGKRYGSFLTREEAIARRDFVLEALRAGEPIPKAFKTSKGISRPDNVRQKIKDGHARRLHNAER